MLQLIAIYHNLVQDGLRCRGFVALSTAINYRGGHRDSINQSNQNELFNTEHLVVFILLCIILL